VVPNIERIFTFRSRSAPSLLQPNKLKVLLGPCVDFGWLMTNN
jgi:hypothetical protein